MLGLKELGLEQSSYFPPRSTLLEYFTDLGELNHEQLEREKESYRERLEHALKVGADVQIKHSGGGSHKDSAVNDLYQHACERPELEAEFRTVFCIAAREGAGKASKALADHIKHIIDSYVENAAKLASVEGGVRTEILI